MPTRTRSGRHGIPGHRRLGGVANGRVGDGAGVSRPCVERHLAPLLARPATGLSSNGAHRFSKRRTCRQSVEVGPVEQSLIKRGERLEPLVGRGRQDQAAELYGTDLGDERDPPRQPLRTCRAPQCRRERVSAVPDRGGDGGRHPRVGGDV